MSGNDHTRITDIAPQNYAISLFASGVCNLKCSYCYIHKNQNEVPKIHKKIIENIRSGAYIDTIKYWFDSNSITQLTHWGSEPTLTLNEFNKFYDDAFKQFPNLNGISFSTNLASSNCVQTLYDFCRFLAEKSNIINRNINFGLQISLDGPPYITNANRFPATYDIIVDNIKSLFSKLGSDELIKNSRFNISASTKSTLTMDQFNTIKTPESYLYFLQCFDDLYSDIDKYIHDNPRVHFVYLSEPTIIYPGSYTTEDGRTLTEVLNSSISCMSHEFKTLKPTIFYYSNFCRCMDSFKNDSFLNQQNIYTCSAGDSCPGIDDDLNIVYCHHAYYNTNNNYIKELSNSSDATTNIKTNRESLLDVTKITKNDSKDDIIKKVMYNRAFSDDYMLKLNAASVLIISYAKLGIISPEYMNPELAELLAAFLVTVRSCPAENIAHTGSSMITPTPIIIAFGNGFFETLIKYKKGELLNDKTIR